LTTEQAISANPSPELLAEAAQRVGAAYSNLYAHQRTGIAFLLSHRRSILADDMGLGKTRQAIIALREAVPFGTRLVICPAGVKLNWKREILMVEPKADIHVVANSRTFEPGHLWTIVNYDLLGKLLPKLLAEDWSGVIADEAHYIKNDSQRSDHVLKLLGVGKGK